MGVIANASTPATWVCTADWYGSACGLKNKGSNTHCAECEAARPEGSQADKWNCGICQKVNYGEEECFMCGHRRRTTRSRSSSRAAEDDLDERAERRARSLEPTERFNVLKSIDNLDETKGNFYR